VILDLLPVDFALLWAVVSVSQSALVPPSIVALLSDDAPASCVATLPEAVLAQKYSFNLQTEIFSLLGI